MRKINKIIVHCSGTPKGKHFDIDDIRKWHLANGWSDVGYHYVILLDGTIQRGRLDSVPGAHTKGHNSNSIGVCWIGGAKGKDTRTQAQFKALYHLINVLKLMYRDAEVLGHRDLSPDKNNNGTIEKSEWLKNCPSFDVKSEWP